MALIVAPVITSARSAKIGWKTVAIPITVALLIWSKLPIVSNPILYIVLGGIGGYIYFTHQLKKLQQIKNQGKENEQ